MYAPPIKIYTDDYTMQWFGRLTRIHSHLSNYTQLLIDEYYDRSIPVQRPLFVVFPDDEMCCDDMTLQDQFMLGSDLLVAPIYEEGKRTV